MFLDMVLGMAHGDQADSRYSTNYIREYEIQFESLHKGKAENWFFNQIQRKTSNTDKEIRHDWTVQLF